MQFALSVVIPKCDKIAILCLSNEVDQTLIQITTRSETYCVQVSPKPPPWSPSHHPHPCHGAVLLGWNLSRPHWFHPESKGRFKGALLPGASDKSSLILWEPLPAYLAVSKCWSLYNNPSADDNEGNLREETDEVLGAVTVASKCVPSEATKGSGTWRAENAPSLGERSGMLPSQLSHVAY